jgi:dihydrofolate synthase/folylpolyglutamate synthase
MIRADTADPGSRLQATLERLKTLHPRVIDLSLGRMERILERLGHPERRLPPVIHVAGTNGKGSTVAFMRAMLEAAGRRVHVYTSPHLVRFNERIRLAGTIVGDDALTDLLERCEHANDGGAITFFEITTAAGLLGFAETAADFVLLETGLGGRLDATNVIARPAAVAITRISYDHMQFLGDSLEGIAAEKAGIMRSGVPAVIAPQTEPVVGRVFAAQAAELGCPLLVHGVDWQAAASGDGFLYRDAFGGLALPGPRLPGMHQIANAGTAIATLRQVEPALAEAAITAGLQTVEWPARLQHLTRGPLAARLPAGWELWLDGGHNDSAGEVLGRHAAAWAADGRPLDLVVAMLRNKRAEDFLRPLMPYARSLVTVPIPGEDAASTPEELVEAARAAGHPEPQLADSVETATARLVVQPGPARLLICGSLYLAGRVLRDNG